MKKSIVLSLLILLCLTMSSCRENTQSKAVVTTTLPVYNFTVAICEGTEIPITRLITENVSCLHDYTLQVKQMRAVENADTIIISGAGLEDFLDDILPNNKNIIDCSQGISLLCADTAHHDEHSAHHHEKDSHIWLSPANAAIMAENICSGLTQIYPEHTELFQKNLLQLKADLLALSDYAQEQLKHLTCRDIITFHDGFSYMCQAFDIHLVHAIEEESGSEASAAELITLSNIVNEYHMPAIFTECNGSTSAADIISAETGAKIFELDMAMSQRDYFSAMRHNIDVLKEALE